MKSYRIDRTGQNVEQLLDKIEGIGMATVSKPGLIAADDKRKLDQVEVDEPLSLTEIFNIIKNDIT